MNRFSTGMCVALAVACAATSASGEWRYDGGLVFATEDVEIKLTNRAQVSYTARDPDLGDSSEFFDVSRFQVRLDGVVKQHWKFAIQANFTDTRNSSRSLEDAYFMYSKRPLAQLWLGQGKTWFGRQDTVSSGDQQFVVRSIATQEFRHRDGAQDNRDVGVAIVGRNRAETYGYSVGVYNGNGINQELKDNTDYMAVARLEITPFGPVALTETDPSRRDKGRLLVAVAARAVTEGTEAIEEETRDSTAVLEVVYRIHGLNLTAEFFTRSEDLPLGASGDEEDTDGWYLQGGWLFGKPRIEVVGRYSEVLREAADSDDTEVSIGANWYFSELQAKVQFQASRLEYEGDPVSPRIDEDRLVAQFQMTF
ncbi:MAG: hypothetical protein GY716_05945 [bacterium]|nr:hypothetical protein [bacterium]